jgi:hypothetical protein
VFYLERRDINIIEIPVVYIADRDKKASSIKFDTSLKMALGIIRVRTRGMLRRIDSGQKSERRD